MAPVSSVSNAISVVVMMFSLSSPRMSTSCPPRLNPNACSPVSGLPPLIDTSPKKFSEYRQRTLLNVSSWVDEPATSSIVRGRTRTVGAGADADADAGGGGGGAAVSALPLCPNFISDGESASVPVPGSLAPPAWAVCTGAGALGAASSAAGATGSAAAADGAKPKRRPPTIVPVSVATKRLTDRLIVVVTEISLINAVAVVGKE